ncbi:MAG: sulfotransferase family 2 domain-containing protein [Cyclobacteriaceae bacterium]
MNLGRRIWIAGRHVKNLVLYGNITPSFFFLDKTRYLAYLNNSKVACSSIKASMYKIRVDNTDNDDAFNLAKTTLGKRVVANFEFSDYFKFTFVRNPFERIFSCYYDKVLNPKGKLYFYRDYLFGYIKEGESFETFVEKACKISDRLADGHFKSQYSLIYRKNKCLVDYIGKMELIQHDFEPLVDKYGLEKLPHYNKTAEQSKPNPKDYYNLRLLDMVYERYKKDFDIWYPGAYELMRQSISEKS